MNLIFRKILLSYFKNKDFEGVLEVKAGENKYVFGKEINSNDSNKIPHADIEVLRDDFFKRVIINGDIGLGEAFFNKDFRSSNIKNLLKWFLQNQNNLPGFNDVDKKYPLFEWAQIFSRVAHLLNKNTKEGSKKNIKKHYDVSNDFYKLWLDETMAYSSAKFAGEQDLREAQVNKYESICQKLELKEADRLLEIGSGWGGFSIYAAKKYGCRITTVTISEKQYNYAKEKIEKEGLGDKIEIRLEDYRDIEGKFDKIVSIEMMEALGHKYVPLFLKRCNELLNDGGKICYQCITFPDKLFEAYLKNNNYIKKYIFPKMIYIDIFWWAH
jgi:cyclopropane-fatty-acyl-phospholipid synthase